MRITTDYNEFFRVTRMIQDWRRLRDLGLILESPLGTMRPRQVHEALEVCAANPDVHIVSHMGNGVFVNRYERLGKLFVLAEGDNDPHYVLDTRHLYMWMFHGGFDKEDVLASLKSRDPSQD